MAKSLFVLYDGRARTGTPPEECSVFDTAYTEEQAREFGDTLWYNYDAVWFEYDRDDDMLKNGRIRRDLPPAQR